MPYKINELQTVLTPLWVVKQNGKYKTFKDFQDFSNFNSTSKTFSMKEGFEMIGVAYYINKTIGDKNVLYQFKNSKNLEYLVTIDPNGEGEYNSNKQTLGSGLEQTILGTMNMFRSYNPSTGIHILNSSTNKINVENSFSPPDYLEEYFNVFGLPRALSNADDAIVSLKGGANIDVRSNQLAGGSIWELHFNQVQMLSHEDYGQGIQSSLNISHTENGSTVIALPTEGGDYVFSEGIGSLCHGSPIILCENDNEAGTQKTRCHPLEWFCNRWNADTYDPSIPEWDKDHINEVVAYNGMVIGKNLTLDDKDIKNKFKEYSIDFEGLAKNVIKYETVFSTKENLTGVNIEIPTGYLTNSFDRYFEVNATKSNLDDGLKEVTNEVNKMPYSVQASTVGTAGGIAIADSNLNNAMGIYINLTKANSIIPGTYYFRNWRFPASNAPLTTSKWSLGMYGDLSSSQENLFTSYIIVGSLDQVRTAMRILYVQGF